jgi:hypothetical protein
MTKARVTIGALALLVAAALGIGYGSLQENAGSEPVRPPRAVASDASAHESLLYGRVTTADGTVYQGRLRWGGDQEALWGSYFNAFKSENPWVAHAPRQRRSVGIFGLDIARWEGEMNGERPFVARMGDITRIERSGRDILVELKSGTEFVLNRMGSDELGDGLWVWDESAGRVELREADIRSVEPLAAPRRGDPPLPIHGTVRTPQGEFTGLVAWDRERSLGSDQVGGLTESDEYRSTRLDAVRSIERRGPGRSLVTLLDGTELLLSGTRDVGRNNRGLYVDDRRYGRVLIPWEAFERVDFDQAGSAPAYDDFPAGSPLRGSVSTHSGRRLVGRLVFDLDETETTETLDAPSEGVDYTLLFGLIASITLPAGTGSATVTLRSGEDLRLERAGDLSDENGGMLVFTAEGPADPDYVPWADVARIDFERPSAMYPPDTSEREP